MGVASVELDGSYRASGAGMGEGAPRGGCMLSGSTSRYLSPVPGGPARGSPPGTKVPAGDAPGLTGSYGRPSAATSCPSRRWHRGRTTGVRSCPLPAGSRGRQREPMENHFQPSGRKLPSPWGFDSGAYVNKGSEGVRCLGWYCWALTCLIFLLSLPSNGLVSFCSLLFLGTFGRSEPPAKEWPTPQPVGGTWPAAVAGGDTLAAPLHPLLQGCSSEQGQDCLLPLTAFRSRSPSALVSSAGAWTPAEGVPWLLCQSCLLADSLWLRRLPCCWPVHSDLLVLVTSTCF